MTMILPLQRVEEKLRLMFVSISAPPPNNNNQKHETMKINTLQKIFVLSHDFEFFDPGIIFSKKMSEIKIRYINS